MKRSLMLVFLLSACVPVNTQSQDDNQSPSLLITLERTACFGTCPVYSLEIYDDGRVVYEGKAFVSVVGKQEAKISKMKITDLIAEFERIDYASLQDEYTNTRILDFPSAITSFSHEGATKTINHYYGDKSAPEALKRLERYIDEVADTARWIGSGDNGE